MQLESLRSQILTQDQLLERVQKSREVDNQELTASVGKQLEDLRAESAELRKQISNSSGASLADLDSRLETDRLADREARERVTHRAGAIVRDYSNSVCLIYAIVGFHDRSDGARLKFAGIDANGKPEADEKGNVIVTTEGARRPVQLHVFGSGFLIDTAGHILTNHHVLEPWWHNAEAIPVPTDKFKPVVESIWAYFPGNDTPLPLQRAALERGLRPGAGGSGSAGERIRGRSPGATGRKFRQPRGPDRLPHRSRRDSGAYR